MNDIVLDRAIKIVPVFVNAEGPVTLRSVGIRQSHLPTDLGEDIVTGTVYKCSRRGTE
jgi:hypothetical protein